MKFYELGTIGGYLNSTFAACHLTYWVDAHVLSSNPRWKWGPFCPACKINSEEVKIPLQMRWFEGCDVIGDFIGSGEYTHHVLVQKRVVEFFDTHDFFAIYEDVEFAVEPPISPRS